MRFFRFRLRSLFLATLLVALCIAGYQCTYWPQKTLEKYIALLDANEDDETAAAMLDCADGLTVESPVEIWITLTAYAKPEERTFGDLLVGRQKYKTGVQVGFINDSDLKYSILPVERIDIVRGSIHVHLRRPNED